MNYLQGLLYCAVGKEYLEQAELSYCSFKKFNSLIKASVYTDQSISNSVWDNVIIANTNYNICRNNLMIYKLDALLNSPYDKTIYLDTDTYILDDITDLYCLLDKFDMIFCHGHNRLKRYELIQNSSSISENKLLNKKIPYCFSPIQGGLIGYRNSKTKKLLNNIRDLYLEKEYFDDQAIIREQLWETENSFYILPPEYNINSIFDIGYFLRSKRKEALPKIFHYTRNKKDNIERLVGLIKMKKYHRLKIYLIGNKILNLLKKTKFKLKRFFNFVKR